MLARNAFGVAAFVAVSLSFLPAILSAQPPNAVREFLDDKRASFSTKGHPKAKGLNLKISYPASWAAAEGERPNIVQKFVSDGGRGLEVAMIITKDLGLPPGIVLKNEDLKELFAPSELRAMVPSGAVFIDGLSSEIEGVPAGIVEYTVIVERVAAKLVLHVWSLNFISGRTLVQVQFQVGGLAQSKREVSHRMKLFKPLFMLMANSIVLPDKWTSK